MIRERAQALAPGDCLAIPLPNGGWGAAVVARAPRAKSSNSPSLVFFFGPQTASPRGLAALQSYCPEQAVMVDRVWAFWCGSHRWPVLGRLAPWLPEDWPIPRFFSDSRVPGPDGTVVPKFWIEEFGPDSFSNAIRQTEASPAEIVGLRPSNLPSIQTLLSDLEWHFAHGAAMPPHILRRQDPSVYRYPMPTPRPPGRVVLPTCEAGDWTAIPVSDDEWVPARIARVSRGKVAPKIAVILLYAFDRRMRGDIDESALSMLRPEDACLVGVTWDDRIRERKWPLVKSQDNFDPARWPIPVFGIRSARGNPDGTASELFFEVHHRDDRLGEVERYVEVDRSRYEALPRERSLTDVEIAELVKAAVS